MCNFFFKKMECDDVFVCLWCCYLAIHQTSGLSRGGWQAVFYRIVALPGPTKKNQNV